MGNQSSRSKKRQIFIEARDKSLRASLHRKSLPRDESLDHVEVPRLFTTLKSFSTEWNLCGKFDPTRRVNVVSDSKLHRKNMKYHFVDKYARLRMNSETVMLTRNELEIMCFLSNFCSSHLRYIHRNLVHLYGYYTFRRKAHMIIEFCELGSFMTAYIRAPDPGLRLNFLPAEDELCSTMHQICSGLDFLHSNGVAHGDLALDNIYVTQENVIKIGDFGRAVFVGPENLPQVLKQNEPPRRAYGAPEMYNNESKKVDLLKADMWSLGIVFIMLLTKKPLFDAATVDDKGFQLYNRVGLRSYLKTMCLEQSALCKVSDAMLDLAEGLLATDPAARITVKGALQSTWLNSEGHASRRHSSDFALPSKQFEHATASLIDE
ncbi:Serine/threonine protein kinase, partial [Globisporangium splendens]